MKKAFILILILILPVLQGCATSYGRQNDMVRVYFKTNATQAIVNCDGEATEVPGNISLRRASNHDCVAKAPGYQDLNFRVWSKISGEGFKYSTKVNWQKWSKWTLGLGNLVAWPIDFFSGAMKNLENDRYDLRLHASDSVSITSKALEKTSNITQKIVSIPADVVEETTGVVMNSVVKKPAEALGLASEEKREDAEKTLEGKAVADHLSGQ